MLVSWLNPINRADQMWVLTQVKHPQCHVYKLGICQPLPEMVSYLTQTPSVLNFAVDTLWDKVFQTGKEYEIHVHAQEW